MADAPTVNKRRVRLHPVRPAHWPDLGTTVSLERRYDEHLTGGDYVGEGSERGLVVDGSPYFVTGQPTWIMLRFHCRRGR
jgi:hypothetical protein